MSVRQRRIGVMPWAAKVGQACGPQLGGSAAEDPGGVDRARRARVGGDHADDVGDLVVGGIVPRLLAG
ncbi:hypothetical protein PUR57_21415 [Streptomyces sp. JV176]|uniref:hypothetical protein n=1 Tax=Streptomyces sp. JV176 TaxID=858630 RepID=UPI002E789553|nr:hypothetical protein [Streptomyces sp. JV176]MEE1801207.1 hypothetical protein [Streptomyces sp. JV176]